MKAFRLLRPDEIECRIQKIKPNGLSLLLYKTARTDADLLDEKVGPECWANDFKEIDGVLYGGIGVDYGHGLVWKWDAGTESNTEAEKGRASDAFKRAGFKHGIGRELYSAPFVWVPADKCTITNGKCNDTFSVTDIGYDENQRIVQLEIVNDKTHDIAYKMGRKSEKEKPKQKAPEPDVEVVEIPLICECCKNAIQPEKNWTVKQIVDASRKKYDGRLFCYKCVTTHRAEEYITKETTE